ncbi:hypothetical protein [Paenibacillus dendritiformis]|uniref:hypothetical protein n=1 Tax=Paenibacillus dendritiformis TaxID=130049 RepID=UPI00387E165F
MNNVVYEETLRNLHELNAFNVPNPIVAKAITMQRLLKIGVSEYMARKAVDHAFVNKGVK